MTHPLRLVGTLLLALTVLVGPALRADDAKPADPAEAKQADTPKDADKPKAEDAPKAEPAAPTPKPEDKPKAEEKPKADDKPKPEEKPADPVHVVKKEPLKIELKLNGVFQAQQAQEYTLRPEFWQQFQVVKAVEHGARVKKGDVLIQFETKFIDEAIRDYEANQAAADLEYQAAQEDLNYMEEAVPIDLASAERFKVDADADLKHYFEVDLPLAKRAVQESVKSYEDFLSYEKEELRQLEKMYKADDLTEETEEIILKRQRDTIHRLLFNLERMQVSSKRTLNVMLPREEVSAEQTARINDLKLRLARTQYPRVLAQRRLSVAKMTRDREKALEQFKRLKRDRAAMTIRANMDGVVYYGDDNRGQWANVLAMSQMLQAGQVVKPGITLLNVVAPRPLMIRTTVPEASLHQARPGIAGDAKPTGFPDLKLDAKLESVAAVPLLPGQFDAKLSVDAGKGADAVVPGMGCAVTLTVYDKKDALTVPASVIQRDNEDAPRYVYVQDKDGKPHKQTIEIGKQSGDKVEVVKGVKEGDKVLLKKPGS